MGRSITLLVGAAVFATALSGPAFSQGAPQTLSLMKVDPQSVATGYRTLQGGRQRRPQRGQRDRGNDRRSHSHPHEKVPFAVLSVGGFLGMGSKYVVVPFSSLEVQDKKMVLRGATENSLRAFRNSSTPPPTDRRWG